MAMRKSIQNGCFGSGTTSSFLLAERILAQVVEHREKRLRCRDS